MNSDADTRRKGWLAFGLALAVWAATTSYVAYRVFVVGLAPDQQRALDQIAQQPFQTLTEPLLSALFMTTLLGVLVLFSVAHLAYTRWRYSHCRRLALEYETLENDE